MITKLFIIVLARDRKHVHDKIRELDNLGVPYRIVCGERLNHPNVVYRVPKGKYDAINFSLKLIPKDVDIVVLNDVDTEIHNFEAALCYLENKMVALVFAKDVVKSGPQVLFHQLLFSILRILPILANGDLMFIRRNVLERIYLMPCKAEDAYILFRVLELGYNAIFSEECYVETKKTENEKEEEMYKRRTVTGIYQALSYTHPPPLIRLFYALLPLSSPLLLVSGKKGYFWMKGILSGFMDYLRGDRGGAWQNA
jgi:hypothetical protein